MLSVVLWPTSPALARQSIGSRSVSRRVFDAYAASDRCVLITKGAAKTNGGAPNDSEVTRLASIRGLSKVLRSSNGEPNLVVLTRSLPCLEARTAKRLLRAAKKGPARIEDAGGRTVALCVEAGRLTRALNGGGISQWKPLLAQIEGRTLRVQDPEELVEIENARHLVEANGVLARRRIARLLAKGVLIPDPEHVQIDDDVVVGAGTTIAPWVILGEGTRIGRHCSIGAFNHILRTQIGHRSVVLDHCYIADSKIGKAAKIGPFSHLRPASVVGNEAKVGNFVELKNTKLGDKGKISHLAYVGDAVAGKDVNIGAGVITCNYDGRQKHRTVVGDGAFIGSDVQLVAPVTIGKGAFVAAGSCIVDDVPAQSLALARSRQVIKEGWAKKKR